MKTIFGLLTFLVINLTAHAQGIRFEKSSDWNSILEKAALENKYIFVDCFASWCVPCKKMDNEIFTDPGVGDFFNKNFISIKVQFDSTGTESADIKSWFRMARYFEKVYNIYSYPTYLYFNPKGQLVSKYSGAITPAIDFVKKSKTMLSPDEQYYTLLERYKNGDRTSTLIKKIVPEALRLQDVELLKQTHEQYVDLIDSPYSKDELIPLYVGISSSDSKGFKLLLNDISKFDRILEDDGRVESVITTHLYAESYDKFVKDQKSRIKWNKIRKYINSKAPGFTDQIVLSMQTNLAHDNKEWERFGKLKMEYYDLFAAKFDHNQLFFMNNDLMEVFRKCKDKSILLRAAQWSKYTLEHVLGNDNAAATDTYANLLYKAGKIKEAILFQKKALDLISRNPKADVTEYVSNLNKMKLGIPTWIDCAFAQSN